MILVRKRFLALFKKSTKITKSPNMKKATNHCHNQARTFWMKMPMIKNHNKAQA